MASLYVGDLHPSVDEAMLFSRFSAAGPVVSIRVCRDLVTRRSLGYAYVNFQQPADAERVIDLLNFELLLGQPIRIMWSQRDPTLRRTGVGNIFIKNLSKDIDTKALHDTFSVFGNILSCKIMLNADNKSKGFGFVHFEREESAQSAIDQVNGMILNNKQVFVGHFKPKAERQKELGDKANKFNNLYIKNFGTLIKDDQALHELFERFGDIISARVFVDEQGQSKGFGFVCFKNPDHAEQAGKSMNGTQVGDRQIFVGRAQEKAERQAELRLREEALRTERNAKFRGVNLYVKNIDDSIDDDRLHEEFSAYGELTSVKVMQENGRSRGFGFVCFSNPEDATKAITMMNGRTIGSKPLYVAIAQRREERRLHLATMISQRFNGNYRPSQVMQHTFAQGPGLDEAANLSYATYQPHGAYQPVFRHGHPLSLAPQYGAPGAPMQLITSNVQHPALAVVQPSSLANGRFFPSLHQQTPVSNIFTSAIGPHFAIANQQQRNNLNRGEYHMAYQAAMHPQMQAVVNGGRIYGGNNPPSHMYNTGGSQGTEPPGAQVVPAHGQAAVGGGM